MRLHVKTSEIKDHFPNLALGDLAKTILFNLGLDEKSAAEFIDIHNLEFEASNKIFGIEKAAKVIEKAIADKKKIVIHGDFDVDGVCASTILWDYLYFVRKADATPIIPNRADEGYGLSEKTIQRALKLGVKLLISVDCGIKDAELVEKYKDKIDFIITDHHQFSLDEKGEIIIPNAKAVVHSIHPKSKFSGMISGAATAWQLVRSIEELRLSAVVPDKARSDADLESGSSIRKKAENKSESMDSRLRGNDKEVELVEFDSDDYLDLVALSTVCDIIPLTIENRKFVVKGLRKIKENKRVGLVELLKICSIDVNNIEPYHFGFVLGPRINAPGRILNDAMDSMRLLSTKSSKQAQELASKLDSLNVQRQDLTKEYLAKAENQIDTSKNAIIIKGEKWPEGILGLIAGKLAEKYYKPVFVASIDAEGHITGSSRSPLDNFYLVKALEHAKDSLSRFGGHKMAAGFASDKELFANFEAKIFEYIENNTQADDFIKEFNVDIEVQDLSKITIQDIEEFKRLEPFGLGNPKPLFLFKACKVEKIQEFGRDFNHIKFVLNHNEHQITAKNFNGAEKYSDIKTGQIIDLLGHLSINEWNGSKTIEIDIKEVLSEQ
jgi:single-stranded-DNA-specific exonuclease